MSKISNVMLTNKNMPGKTMSLKLKLDDIIKGIEFQSDFNSSYLNKLTGKIFSISDEEFLYAEMEEELTDIPDWQKENIEIAKQILSTDDYISLPDKFDIEEYRLMEKFSLSQLDESIREDLYYSIKGSGAFRRFKEKIYEYKLADDWYKYRDKVVKDIAKYWCEENNIEYFE